MTFVPPPPFFNPHLLHAACRPRWSSHSPQRNSRWLCPTAPPSASRTAWVQRSTPSSALRAMPASRALKSSKSQRSPWKCRNGRGVFLSCFQSGQHEVSKLMFPGRVVPSVPCIVNNGRMLLVYTCRCKQPTDRQIGR